MYLKILSTKCQPDCLSLNVLNCCVLVLAYDDIPGDIGYIISGNGLLPDVTITWTNFNLLSVRPHSYEALSQTILRYQSLDQNWKLHFQNCIKVSQELMS